MRTTLSLDDDAVEIAQRLAMGRKISLGEAVSDLVRRSATLPARTKEKNGLVVFDLPPDYPIISSDRVRQLLDEEH